MLPGKQYAIEDVLQVLRRRVWFILVPAAIVAAGAALFARSLPDLYQSQTTILIVPQRISEEIVRSTITSRIEDRLASISDSILSRARLESLIEEFDLYKEERATKVMEEVVALMRSHINRRIIRDDAFELSYVGEDPLKVMRVTERLGSLFISQSLSYRHNLATDTDEFLDAELAETRRQLEERERRLENYRRTYAGQLPTEAASNLQQVQIANSQVQAARDAINRGMERRMTLDQRIADLEKPGSEATVVLSDGEPTGVVGSTLQQLTVAQAVVARLEARGLRPGHPDLDAAVRQVRDLQAKWTVEEAAIASREPSAPVQAPTSPAEAQRLMRLAEARSELVEVNRQIARAREEEERARANAAAAQTRLEAMPTRESEMLALMRDYDIYESSYRNLLQKREDSRISSNLERRQVGEQFNVLEPARLPERPFSPIRGRIYSIGLGLGLALGIGLIVLLEYRDRSFKSDDEVASLLGLPVLAVIPQMQSERDRRRAFFRRVGVAAGCCAVIAGCAAVFVYAVIG